ncbi:IDEAL domain-containing protein [Fictibacillus iocasae]|uniref:IDEAL domain-containing protein n=1 Tax=Fictibacillus iocasae TaxID=2715437 RepID=A0ABW2NTE8_9BACL
MKDNTSFNHQNKNELVKYKLQKKADPFAFSLIAQMVLDESLHGYYKSYYEKRIDEALEKRDRDLFMKLTAEYKKFLG